MDENDPTYGAVVTTYAYDLLNHLTSVSMTRPTPYWTSSPNKQMRRFNYNQLMTGSPQKTDYKVR